jgi:hypothetical protein
MIAQVLSLLLFNSNLAMGGQGYCVFEFTFEDYDAEYQSAQVRLRPLFDPNETSTGNTELEDVTVSVGSFGGSRAAAQETGSVETDCSITGFEVMEGSATVNGEGMDIINSQALEVDQRGDGVPLTITGN